jgi:hypothetical protein
MGANRPGSHPGTVSAVHHFRPRVNYVCAASERRNAAAHADCRPAVGAHVGRSKRRSSLNYSPTDASPTAKSKPSGISRYRSAIRIASAFTGFGANSSRGQ